MTLLLFSKQQDKDQPPKTQSSFRRTGNASSDGCWVEDRFTSAGKFRKQIHQAIWGTLPIMNSARPLCETHTRHHLWWMHYSVQSWTQARLYVSATNCRRKSSPEVYSRWIFSTLLGSCGEGQLLDAEQPRVPGLVAYMCPEVEGGEGGQVVLEAVAEMFNSKKRKKKDRVPSSAVFAECCSCNAAGACHLPPAQWHGAVTSLYQ